MLRWSLINVEPSPNGQARRKGIYLLPNLFTTGCLFAGFYAIISAINGQFEQSAMAIFVAMVLDGLDGRVARLTNTESEFGVQYDSLADMISFGLAPALIMFVWSLNELGKLGWLVSFVYAAAAALRLARFNTQVESVDKRFFQGLPSPSAAAVIAGMVWVGEKYNGGADDLAIFALVLTLLAGILMVSNMRYYSFKDIDFKGKIPFVTLLVMVMVFVFISIDPPQVLFFIFLVYLCSGPFLTIWGLRQKRAERRMSGQDTDNKDEDTNSTPR